MSWTTEIEWPEKKIDVLSEFEFLNANNQLTAVTIKEMCKAIPHVDRQMIRIYCNQGVEEGYLTTVLREDKRGTCYHLTKKGRETEFNHFLPLD